LTHIIPNLAGAAILCLGGLLRVPILIVLIFVFVVFFFVLFFFLFFLFFFWLTSNLELISGPMLLPAGNHTF